MLEWNPTAFVIRQLIVTIKCETQRRDVDTSFLGAHLHNNNAIYAHYFFPKCLQTLIVKPLMVTVS